MPNRCQRRHEADMLSQASRARGQRAKATCKMGGSSLSASITVEAFRNLFRAPLAGCGALRFGDPLGDVVACGVIQLVIPAPKRAVFAENVLEFIGDGHGPFFAVEFDLKTGDAAFDRVRSLLHPLVDQQDMLALSSGK